MKKRIAIILKDKMTIGQSANVAAILGGAAAAAYPELHHGEVSDSSGVAHASVRYSHVLLRATAGQLMNFAVMIRGETKDDLHCVVFSQDGQQLFHSEYEAYKTHIGELPINEIPLVGLLLLGNEDIVKALTKKFSLL